MLVEEERAAGLEDTPRFANNSVRVMHHAQHQGRNNRVETRVSERKALTNLLDYGGIALLLGDVPSQSPDHVAIRFDESYVRGLRIVRQVRARAAADFQHITRCQTGSPLAIRNDATFHTGIKQVIPRREQALTECHGNAPLVGLNRRLFERGLSFVHQGQIDVMPFLEIASALYQETR